MFSTLCFYNATIHSFEFLFSYNNCFTEGSAVAIVATENILHEGNKISTQLFETFQIVRRRHVAAFNFNIRLFDFQVMSVLASATSFFGDASYFGFENISPHLQYETCALHTCFVVFVHFLIPVKLLTCRRSFFFWWCSWIQDRTNLNFVILATNIWQDIE